LFLFFLLAHQNSICIPLLPNRVTCPAHLILLGFVNIILGEDFKLQSSSSCIFLQLPDTPYHFGPLILLSALFSNTLTLRSFCLENRLYTMAIFYFCQISTTP
jgi:hypothetical protein